jgi:hypothetical protein
MAKKKSKSTAKAPKFSPAMFKVTGVDSLLKVSDKSQKLYYFAAKVDPEKASKVALTEGADVLGVSVANATAAKPALKYDFYCTYDATLERKFLRVRKQEFGVNDQVKGVLVGKEVVTPGKGDDVPGNSVRLNVIELFETTQKDGMTVDGLTGGPAREIETLLKGPGKKVTTPAWVRRNSISAGPFASVDKVVKAVSRVAASRPSDAKRVVLQELNFKELNGFYVPTYYVKVTSGKRSKTMKINAINGNVSVQV